jgi:hypothetical protein
MVNRHYSLNLKQWSVSTLYVYAHADLARKYSVSIQIALSGRKFFFLALMLIMDDPLIYSQQIATKWQI